MAGKFTVYLDKAGKYRFNMNKYFQEKKFTESVNTEVSNEINSYFYNWLANK